MDDPANAGRPVILVSHSWGTVMSKLAIDGGTTKDGVLNPLRDATRGHTPESRPVIDSWFTLGSPLGREGVAFDLGQIGVDVEQRKPGGVRTWTNVLDSEIRSRPTRGSCPPTRTCARTCR